MRIPSAGLALATLLTGFAAALAQPVESPPDGWTMDAIGFAHAESLTRCPFESDGFKRVRISGAQAPGVIGTCAYEDAMGTGDAGLRVRRYVPGAGDNAEAIDNDRALMEPDPVQGAPLFTVRIVPFAPGDAKKGARIIITKVRGGLLIDCYAEDADFGGATAKIAAVCNGK